MTTLAEYNKYGEDLERIMLLRTSPIAVKMLKTEADIPDGRPHILVVMCSCCNTLDSVLNWERIEQILNNLPGNLEVKRMDTVCDPGQWGEVKQILRESPANRLIIAACNPLIYCIML